MRSDWLGAAGWGRPVRVAGVGPAPAEAGLVSAGPAGVLGHPGVLTEAGYHVIAARNGVEGLALAKQHDYALDGIVTDVVMPEMGGRAMVEQLRLRLPGVRVLYMSGYTDDMETLGEIRATTAADDAIAKARTSGKTIKIVAPK